MEGPSGSGRAVGGGARATGSAGLAGDSVRPSAAGGADPGGCAGVVRVAWAGADAAGRGAVSHALTSSPTGARGRRFARFSGPSSPRDHGAAGVQRTRAGDRDRQTRELSYAASLFRDPPAGSWVRHSHCPGAAGSSRRVDDHDLHPRAQPWWSRREEPGRHAVILGLGRPAYFVTEARINALDSERYVTNGLYGPSNSR